MSANQLRQTTGNAPAASQAPKDIAGLLNSQAVKTQIAKALPRHMTSDRLARIATT